MGARRKSLEVRFVGVENLGREARNSLISLIGGAVANNAIKEAREQEEAQSLKFKK